MAKITYATKVGINPKTVHINQVWDDDMNEIKTVVNGLDDDKANKTNVLELDNTTAFTPDTDYEPATKKYVDDNGDAQDLQAVLDNGNEAEGVDIELVSSNGWYESSVSAEDIIISSTLETRYAKLDIDFLELVAPGRETNYYGQNIEIDVDATNSQLIIDFYSELTNSGSHTVKFQHKTGTIALLSDITGGSGDMSKSTYDTNDNGVVDNSEKVNGLTVQTAVPSGALFTDTVYNDSDVLKDADTVSPVSGINKILTQAEAYDDSLISVTIDLNTAARHTHSNKSDLDNVSGTNTGDNAVNSLYSGLVSNATHTGDVTGATVLSIADDVITNDHLTQELKDKLIGDAYTKITDLGNVSGTVNIDWSLAIKYKLNLTGNTTLNFINVTNYEAVKTQILEITSNSASYTLAHETGVDAANDLADADLSLTNHFTFFCHRLVTPFYQSSVKTE